MKINRCGYQFRHMKGFNFSRPFGSDDYYLTVTGAPFYVYLNGEIVDAPANTVLLIRRGSLHFVAAKEDWVNDFVHFSLDESDMEWVNALDLPFDTLVPLDNTPALSNIICNMCREKEAGLPHSEELALMYLRILLHKLSDIYFISKSSNPTLKQQFFHLHALIMEHPEEDWTTEDLAKRFSISVSYFQHKYKAYFGCSLKKDVTMLRIERAKQMLASETTVAEIAKKCGFTSDIHFMRLFKECTGTTPTAYRKQITDRQ